MSVVLLKHLWLKNTRVCCLALKAAPLPYLFGHVDPRLRHLLKREDVRKFFQEVDLNALLQSVSKVILIIRNGYSVLCLRVPQNVWQIATDKITSLVCFLRQLLTLAIENGGPFLAYLYAENRQLAIEFAQRLPSLTVSAAKRLARLGILFRTCFSYVQKFLAEVKDTVSPQLFLVLQKYCQNFLSDEHVKKVFKFMVQYVQTSSPSLKVLAKIIVSEASRVISYLKVQLQHFLQNTPNPKEQVSYYLSSIYRTIKKVVSFLVRTYQHVSPYAVRIIKSMFDGLACIFRYTLQYILPVIKQYFQTAFRTTRRAAKDIKRIFDTLLACTPLIIKFIQSYLHPIAIELQNSALQCSKELSTKSFQGLKTILPSLFGASKAVTKQTTKALSEVSLTSKNSVVIVYPVVVEAVRTIHPQVSQSLIVVFTDSQAALKGVVTEVLTRSIRTQVVFTFVCRNLPVVIQVVNRVSTVTFHASTEVTVACYKAKSRVIDDVQKGKETLNKSYISAEEELKRTLQEALANDPDLLEFAESKIAQLSSRSRLKNQLTLFFKRYFKHCMEFTERSQFIQRCINTFVELISNFFASPLPEKQKDLLVQYIQQLFTIIGLDVVPQLWSINKKLIQRSWQGFCKSTSSAWRMNSWFCMEIWNMICIQTPRIWLMFKDVSQMMWTSTCAMSPFGWKYVTYVTPTIWSCSRDVVKWLWSTSLNVSDEAWNHVLVPATSATWTQAQAKVPTMWVVFCDTSKRNWVLLSTSAESRWVALTAVTATSWAIGDKFVKKVWQQRAKQVTQSTISTLGKSWRMYNAARQMLRGVRSLNMSWTSSFIDLKNSMEKMYQLPGAALENMLNKMMEPLSDFDVGQDLFTY